MKNSDQNAAGVTRFHTYSEADRQQHRKAWGRWIEDPLKPRTEKGNLRINPILLFVAAVALAAGATFLFFSVVQP